MNLKDNLNSLFKAYDVRGIYPSELNEQTVYLIARAFALVFIPKKVVVGYDARISSPSLFENLVSGLSDGGVLEILNLGLTGTEVMYFATGSLEADAGIMITASHNPGKYNGLKFCGFGASPISLDNGLELVKEAILQNKFPKVEVLPNVQDIDIYPSFIKKLKELVDFKKIKNFKIVVDAGNGVGGIVLSKIFEELGVEMTPLFFEPDGNFPNHEANPAKIENIESLRNEVLRAGADLGIALDGDGDRVFFIDDQGNYLSGYFLTSLLSIEMLKKYPKSSIVHESRVCWAIIDNVKKYEGSPVVSKCGHSNIKKVMRELDAPFGGENSSHFFYKDLYFADSSVLTILLLLKILSEENQKLSEVMQAYLSSYFISPEINFEVSEPKEVLKKIEDHFQNKGYEISKLDGLIIDNNRDWHVSVRISNTEPLVRLNVEAKNQEILDKVVLEVQDLIVN